VNATSNHAGPGLAVITGGASGIGLAFARAYATRGARVLIGDIDEAAMDCAAEQIRQLGAAVTTSVVDLQDSDSVVAFGAMARDQGTMTAVCLNAGITSTGPTVWDTSLSTFDALIGVNLRGLFHSVKTFVPALIAQGKPADIVITASMAGMVACPHSGAYAASKAGAIALAKSLRAELQLTAPALRLALLNPGVVRTNLIRTSAAHLPPDGSMSEDLVNVSHDALDQSGVEPGVAVAWALKALEDNSFWAHPPAGDPFREMLAIEFAEITDDQSLP
jgi:NAD(P)-dependent dehydrogenase (short-subunit alcohol dehydrogenase family)